MTAAEMLAACRRAAVGESLPTDGHIPWPTIGRTLEQHITDLERDLAERAAMLGPGVSTMLDVPVREPAIGVGPSALLDEAACDYCGFGPLPENWAHRLVPAKVSIASTDHEERTICGFCYRSHAAYAWIAGGETDRDAIDAAMRANILRAEILAAR